MNLCFSLNIIPLPTENFNTTYIESIPWVSVFFEKNFLSPPLELTLFLPGLVWSSFRLTLLHCNQHCRNSFFTSGAWMIFDILVLWFNFWEWWFNTNRIVFMYWNDALRKLKQVHEHLFVQLRSFYIKFHNLSHQSRKWCTGLNKVPEMKHWSSSNVLFMIINQII